MQVVPDVIGVIEGDVFAVVVVVGVGGGVVGREVGTRDVTTGVVVELESVRVVMAIPSPLHST